MTEHKLHLIQQISVIDTPNELEAFLEKELEEMKAKKGKKANKNSKNERQLSPLEQKMLKPMRKKFDPEEMKREQGWTGKHDKEGIMRLIKEMDVKEPIEEMLALLTK
ncbi:MAG: hypothetical protein IT258_17840 [Saprospiraceae bacterium]|nr:hypothetical protein [Saprospiraceae bacterium]